MHSSIRVTLLLALAGFARSASGQDVSTPGGAIDIAAFAGYAVNGDVVASGGTLRVDDAASYGASMGFALQSRTKLELSWIYSGTQAQFLSGSPAYSNSPAFNLAMHYFQAGGTVGFLDGAFRPFLSGSLGAALYLPGSVNLGSAGTFTPAATWRFAFTLGVGLEYFFSKVVGLRLDARLLAPVYFSSGSFYAGAGGSALTVSGGVPFVQGCFTGGLVVSL